MGQVFTGKADEFRMKSLQVVIVDYPKCKDYGIMKSLRVARIGTNSPLMTPTLSK